MPFCVWREYCRTLSNLSGRHIQGCDHDRERKSAFLCIHISLGEKPGMQTARGQSALLDTGTCVLHGTKLFRWIMAYNQYKFTAWLAILGKCSRMLINTIE